MMPPSIVYNNNHLTAFAMSPEKKLQERLKCIGIKRLSTLCDKGAVSNANCPQYPDMLSGWGMKCDRVFNVRRYPHCTPRTVLLEMTFVFKPEVNVISFC